MWSSGSAEGPLPPTVEPEEAQKKRQRQIDKRSDRLAHSKRLRYKPTTAPTQPPDYIDVLECFG